MGHRRGVLKDTEFRAEYETLEQSLPWPPPRSMGKRRQTQAQVAKAMGTTQAVIARPEGGPRPSTRTLERFAKATGTRLRIRFEPDRATV